MADRWRSEGMSHRLAACDSCLRRSGALAHLSVRIDHAARDPEAVQAMLALTSEELIEAIGGRRRSELRALCAAAPAGDAAAACTCRHATGAPQRLSRVPGRPAALWSLGGRRRLHRALGEPTVAILGTRRPSDYGAEVARALGRGLSAAGVTVCAPFQEGISAAAIAGALSGGRGVALAAAPGGLSVARPASLATLRRGVLEHGCLVSPLPGPTPPRRWSGLAAQTLAASLACAIVVVEARDDRDLAAARIGARRAVPLAAVPGRVNSPCARGPNALLKAGASLVGTPEDVLDLLYGSVGAAAVERPPTGGTRPAEGAPRPQLDPAHRQLLDRIGDGQCTLEALTAGPDAPGTLVALSELEALGLLARDQAGRYLARLTPAHRIGFP